MTWAQVHASDGSAISPVSGRQEAESAADARPTADVFWPAVSAIAWREVVRFLRQRNRVFAAVVTPVVFWLLLGFGLNEVAVVGVDTSAGGTGYLEYFFPGMIVMVVLFTSIFSTITVIDDRNSGFLQGVLASPAKRGAIVGGKVLGGAAIATLHGVVLLPIWCVFFDWSGGWPGVGGLVLATLVMFVMAAGLTGLGLWFAWPMDSTSGYHAVMNLVQFPMWFLSGAVFPVATAGALGYVMLANPLTYGYTAFAGALRGNLGQNGGLS
ncbi:MAG: ABC transporter permease, partial [Planctomycetota bacterium]